MTKIIQRVTRLISSIFFISIFMLTACGPGEKVEDDTPPEKEPAYFTGIVVDYQNNPIEGVSVVGNAVSSTTGANGKFELKIPTTEKYIINFSKEGYAFVSKVFMGSRVNVTYRMKRSTVVKADPTQEIVVKDTVTECEAIVAIQEAEMERLKAITPVMNHLGKVVDFGIPDELFEKYNKYQKRETCNTGATVRIPANALAIPGNTGSFFQDKKEVTVSVSTIDIFSQDGMPGDWSVRSQEQPRFMVSFGALTIDVTYEGKPVDLIKGQTAEVMIPIDPLAFGTSENIPPSIPFLSYNRESGLWNQDGEARFDKERMAYIGETSHFSEFNMDIFKSTPSCQRFCLDPDLELAANLPDELEVIMVDQDNGTVVTRKKSYSSGGSCLTADYPGQFSGCGSDLNLLYNLSNNEPMLLKMNKAGSTVSMVVVQTGDPAINLNPNNSVNCPYGDCCQGDATCVDACTSGGAPILKGIGTSNGTMTATTDIAGCKVVLKWYDPFAETDGAPFVSSNFVIETTSGDPLDPGTTWDAESTTVTEIRPGLYTAELTISESSGADLDCFALYFVRASYVNNPGPYTQHSCIDLSAGCSGC